MPVLLLAALLAAPADTIQGRVRSADGAGIPAASVRLPDLRRETSTDSAGRFRLAGIPVGSHLLVIEAPGFAPAAVRAASGSPVEVALKPAGSTPLPALVVTAAPGGTEAGRTPLAHTTLGPDELAKNASVAIARTTEAQPGVRSLTTGAQIAKPVIRGLTGARVLVLDDSHRLEDYSWSDEDGPSIDASLVDRVEIVRGAASVLYGSDALAGVVNALPPVLPDGVGAAPFHGWRAGLGFASNNAEVDLSLRYQGARGKVGWRAAAVGRRAASLRTPEGELDHTGFGAFNGELAATVRGASGNLTVRAAHYGGEYKLLEASGPPPGTVEGEEEGPERKVGDDRIQADWLRLAGDWTVRAGAQYQRHSLIELSDEAGGTPGVEGTAFDLLMQGVAGQASGSRAWGGLTATIGVSGSFEANDTRGPIPLVPDADVAGGSGSLVLEDRTGRLTLSAGGRIDARHLATVANPVLGSPGESRDYTAFSGVAGATVDAGGGLLLRANVGQSWRAPTLFELYANGPHLGEARFERGDASLSDERGAVLDVGARLERDRLRIDASVYDQRIHDYIYLAPTDDVIGGYQVYQHVAGTASLTGFEGEVAVDVAPTLTVRLQGDAVRATNADTEEPLPLTPPLRGVLGIAAHHGRWLGVRNGTAEVDLVMVDEQRRLAPLDVPTAAYALVNLDAGFDVSLAHHGLHVGLGVRNLLDKAYRDYLSRYKQFALNPGRDVFVRLDWAL